MAPHGQGLERQTLGLPGFPSASRSRCRYLQWGAGPRRRFLRWPRGILGLVVPKVAPRIGLRCGAWVGWILVLAANAIRYIPNDLPNDNFSELTSHLQNCNAFVNSLQMVSVKVNSIPPAALRFAKITPVSSRNSSSPFSFLEPCLGEPSVLPRQN